MDKLKFETPDMVAGNIEKIEALFPAAITEMRGEDGQIKKGINFEVLKQLLSRDVVDGDECYEFTWVGKKAAMAEAARPITKTLRPVKEDSRDWDTTQNLYIEGDNLEVLKILQESYLGKVKMIYIDPPYNTGHDFIYRDKFQRSQQEENEKMGMYDEEENQMFENTESNGRFHSDWCSYIYRTLILARNLLTDDGAIFIHIDEHEKTNLYKMCIELWGPNNFLGEVIWDKRNPKGEVLGVAYQHETIFAFCKNRIAFAEVNFSKCKEHANEMIATVKSLVQKEGKVNEKVRIEYKNWLKSRKQELSGGELAYNLVNDLGEIYRIVSMAAPDKPETRSHRPLLHPITHKPCPTPAKGWRFTDSTMDKLLEEGKIEFGIDESVQPNQRYFLKDNIRESFPSLIYFGGSADVLGLPFDTPKPVPVAKKIIDSVCNNKDDNSIILDFFSGSATTAHAVMQLNAEDGGHRKFIMVQLPEPCDEKSEAFKDGYKNICDIGKERIRRAGDKIKAENPLGTQDLDIGFRVFRVDRSNMKDVYYQPEELEQQSLLDMVSNIKDDRTDMDLLYACLLDWGVEIHLHHTSTDLDGCTVHNVDNGALMACFSPNVPRSVVEYMAKQQPLRAVFRDSAFASDDAKINVTEIFKNLSPDTKVKVI